MERSLHNVEQPAAGSPALRQFEALAYSPLLRALFQFRWVMLAALLLIAALWPLPTRAGLPLWAMLGTFGLYNGLLQLAATRTPRLTLEARIPLLDLLVIAGLYALGTEPAGASFTLFVLALLSAAVLLPLRQAVGYTLAAMAVVVLLAPTLDTWSTASAELNVFAARLLILPLVGIGAALLLQQLARAQLEAMAHQREAEQLAELERLRADFVASISHDLNTPLTAINVALGLLEDTAEQRLRADQFRLLRNARRNGERLKRLIDDLLTHNRLSAGALPLEREAVDLREVAGDACSAVHALAEDKGQNLTLELLAALPVVGDRRQLERALVNLLCNAHEHTPPGTRITLKGEALSSEVHLSVHDTGPGIPPELHEAIFEPFRRNGAAGSGSGLGLAIVRRLVELHGGRVWVESAPGKGTAFQIRLPRHQGARRQERVAEHAF